MSRIAAIVLAMFFVVSVFSVAHSQQDIEPPQLLDVQFEPQVIDTSKGPQVITVTAHITDDLSGLRRGTLRFQKPGTTQQHYIAFWSEVEPIEGDSLDGLHQATMVLPQYAALGAWEMYEVFLEDKVGNSVTFRRVEGEEAQEDEWPSLFNGFGFEVEELSGPQQSPSLYLPLLGL